MLWPKGPWITALGIAFVGLILAAGGARLILLGGSWYYAMAGIALLVCAVLLWRGKADGVRLYGLILAATFLWAFYEVGVAPWLLMPRVLGPLLIGLWLMTPWVRRKLDFPVRAPSARRLFYVHLGITLMAVTFLIAVVVGARVLRPATVTPQSTLVEQGTDWPAVGRTLTGTRFAPSMQINPDNVSALHEAWRFHTGSVEQTFEATPIIAGGLLVFCTARNVVIALDPETGERRWRYDPQADANEHMLLACRGVSSFSEPQANGAQTNGPCAERVFVATIDARLIALDARTGALCAGFGDNGAVSLMTGIGDYPRGFYYSTSPPLVANGVVVVGAFVLDNQTVAAPSGVVRAYDARTGALRWAWDMGRPNAHGAPPRGETFTQGTPNAWSVFSADPELGLVYLPMGNPAPDFWGGRRRDFDERYGSAIVALDLRTGAPRWAFQTTHHDLWDYDVPSQPVLVDIPTAQGPRRALVQGTKRGDIFVLDRATGEPIFPVAEHAAPQGAAPGDHLAPTQPHSSISLAPPVLKESDMWGLSPIDQLLCRIQFRQLRYQGQFTPPGLTASLKFPGGLGVMDWGGFSIDEERAILVANTSAVPYVDQLVPRPDAPDFAQRIGASRSYDWGPQEGAPFVIHTRPFLSRAQIPCTAPPWGRINAIDLRTGQVLWSHALGTGYDSGPFYARSHLPLPMGVPNIGGAITTRSGLTFVAASVDRYLRAFDTHSGRELWRGRLPAAGHATPMTFVSPGSGRQFVVIAAGGHASMGPHRGDTLVAYALPVNLLHAPANEP